MEQSEFYPVFTPLKANGERRETLFTMLSEEIHAALKRPISNAYSMTTMRSYEPFVDDAILKFVERLNDLYGVGDVGKFCDCDIATWLQYCK
jgi:hypothetical protein